MQNDNKEKKDFTTLDYWQDLRPPNYRRSISANSIHCFCFTAPEQVQSRLSSRSIPKLKTSGTGTARSKFFTSSKFLSPK